MAFTIQSLLRRLASTMTSLRNPLKRLALIKWMKLSLLLVETMTEKVRERPAGRKSGLMKEMKALPNLHGPY